MMAELVVLHERAVDDRDAEIYVEQNGHRLHFANDDVAQYANEGKQALTMSPSPRQLADGALVLLAQPLQHRLKPHAKHANGMEQQQHRHAPSAESLEDRHALARRHRERDSLSVAVEQVDV